MLSAEPDPGFSLPNVWDLDAGLVGRVKAAVLTLRKENEWAPRKRANLVFRASELGDLAAVRDAKGKASGCARKTFYSFWPEEFVAREFDAETLLNFDEGNKGEDRLEVYLKQSGLLADGQVRFGAWTPCITPTMCDSTNPRCGVSPFVHGDHRYPDRSGGLVRGKADFIINHPVHGRIPLEWKTASSYVADMVAKGGPKPENALQALFYAHEMGTTHGALGYTNKETGNFEIYIAPAQPELMASIFARARWLRGLIQAGELPPMPRGARAAAIADPAGSRFSAKKRLPDDAFFDNVWPCYAWSEKKKRVNACAYYEACHGALPAKPIEGRRVNPLLRRKKTSSDTLHFVN
jgi:hypothetical protein